ncbi:Phosphoglucomutase-2 [Borealophlyctis nickersoniae]|nr:Phosphoglucomutase-2 [Borealophlyctis nickersoniae]
MDLSAIARQYLTIDQNENDQKEIRALLEAGDHVELQKRLGSRLSFGTAGLRAEMGAGYSRMNDLTVLQASQGLCAYVLATNSDAAKQGVVIGRDHRHNSESYARLTAAAFIHKGVKGCIFYFRDLVHTPLVPFAVTHYGAACGVMITASHNPKNDNGYKVYWSNGSQIIPPHDKGIAESIEKNLDPWLWDYTLAESSPLSVDPGKEIISSYFAALAKLSTNRALNSSTGLKICYTAMHGVGHPFAARAFETFALPPFISVKEQIYPDPDFPTVEYPNPEEGKGALALAMQTARTAGARLILANDPDGINFSKRIQHHTSSSDPNLAFLPATADRLAIAEQLQSGEWHIFSGNEIGAILGVSLWRRWRKQNPTADPGTVAMLISTVSSKLLQHVGRIEGFRCEDTLTGFKWLGNRALDLKKEGYNVLFGFEEAIGRLTASTKTHQLFELEFNIRVKGFMIGDVVRDKDGISALAVAAEIVVELEKEGMRLYDLLQEIYKKYGYFVSDNSYFICHSQDKIKKIFDKMRYGTDGTTLSYPSHIGQFKVVAVRDLTAGYDTDQPDKKPILPVSKSSQMITFRLENGAVFTLRTSGTEPKIKYYSELSGSSVESARKELSQVVASFVDQLLEPAKNELGFRKE